MQFIIDLVVTIVTIYLSFTNNLADKIIELVPSESEKEIVDETVPLSESSLPSLPSIFETKTFPDILLRSTDYQKASAVDSITPNITTTDPLAALVNIFCTFTSSTTIRTTTGTGFFVHSSGVILTNAHVAQYLLLEETDALGEAECIVRQGTPAEPKFRAELLYIPPTWVQNNAAMISESSPTGTGERDYALLYVTESLNNDPLPKIFPALALNTELLPRSIKGNGVMAVGYPATAILKHGASTPLLSVLATTTISELYTFGSNYADVFSIKGSAVGDVGSSGGPIIDENNKVIGVIVTRGDDENDGEGSLRAITLSHINRTILEETGFSLEQNTSGNLSYRANIFTNTLAPFLISLLSKELII